MARLTQLTSPASEEIAFVALLAVALDRTGERVSRRRKPGEQNLLGTRVTAWPYAL